MYADPVSSTTDTAIADRVRWRTMAQRKRRILVNVLLIVLITAGMFYIVLWQRDDQAVRSISEISGVIAGALQKDFDATGHLPDQFPDLGPTYKNAAARYLFNTAYSRQIAEISPVVVCVTTKIHLYLRGDGYSLVLFDQHDFKPVWMSVGEFQERAADLRVQITEGVR